MSSTFQSQYFSCIYHQGKLAFSTKCTVIIYLWAKFMDFNAFASFNIAKAAFSMNWCSLCFFCRSLSVCLCFLACYLETHSPLAASAFQLFSSIRFVFYVLLLISNIAINSFCHVQMYRFREDWSAGTCIYFEI